MLYLALTSLVIFLFLLYFKHKKYIATRFPITVLFIALATGIFSLSHFSPFNTNENLNIQGGGLKGINNSLVQGEADQKELDQSFNTNQNNSDNNTGDAKFDVSTFFTSITDPSPSFKNYDYISGDMVITDLGILRIKPNAINSAKIQNHSIQAEDLDSNSITSRIIENGTILGEDISKDANLEIQSLTVGEVIISGNSSITGDMDMNSHIITNIGNAGTDFTATGGLNLADGLVSAGPLQGTSLNTGQGAYELFAMDQNVLSTSTPTFAGLNLNGNLTISGSIIPTADIAIDLGNMTHRFNNIYSANIYTSAISTAGQAVFNFEPTDTTYANASVLINPTNAISNAILLGIGVSGVQRFSVDEDGDINTGGTLNTGQGAYELYAMDQNVLTTSTPTLGGLTLNGNLVLGTNTLTTTNTTLISNLNADLLDGQQGTYYLNTGTNFGGDVSGTYNAIAIADDSHSHTASTLPATTSYLGQTIESIEITDGTITTTDLNPALSLLSGQTLSYGLGTLTANALDTALTYGVSISGNSSTVTNGLYNTGTYNDPAWLNQLSGLKITSDISYNSANITGTVSIGNGGTGQTTAPTARNALLPSQATNANKFLQTDGTNTTWQNILWSSLGAPTANLSLAMQSYTTTLTYGATTGLANLFNITDTTNNAGTGYLVNITTTNPSLLKPFSVSANSGVFPAIAVDSTGKVGIGTITPTSQLTVVGGATFGVGYDDFSLTDGNVAIENSLGIGTTAPLSKLGVLGNASIGATYGAIAAPTSSLIVENKIGIGVTNPTAKLEIGGTAGVDGIKFPDGTIQTTAKPFICGSVIYDVDNNAYETVAIGTQCWMKSNLMTTKYSDGSAITRGPTTIGGLWDGTDKGFYAYPPAVGNGAEADLETDIKPNHLGFVYQWSAVMKGSTTEGVQGVCPTGWHVPTDVQQNTLDQYLTDYGQTCNAARVNAWDCLSAGSKLSMSTLSGNNSSGFTGILAGGRDTDGSFGSRTAYALIWSSSQNGASNAWNRYLGSGNATVYRYAYAKAHGFSVRCLKD